jgi:hypothetical protein
VQYHDRALKPAFCRATIAALALAGLAAVNLSAAQAQSATIPGYMDLKTGRFVSRRLPPALAPALTTYSGTINVKLSITIQSALSDTQVLVCSADVSAEDPAFNLYEETASVTATRSGATATCTMTIPYLWSLGSGATFLPGYSVFATSKSLVLRSTTSAPQTALKVPAAGTTTNLSYNVVL